ncbi:hypothetical protein P167DRAFT_569853 [Morchella conica CCBAS932]|uniref:Uncharacterized protein n=1 Tax=Morchella conica CCBAS932 TaxID=1392247 RepID=A0A3N4LHG2_9PEZI|nr:hypothetical protein P167DRAFT_569853 [Morchella conica CCBAS932]
MWQNEFYYLNGQVSLTNHESGADYNLGYANRTWQQVVVDINQKPDNLTIKRYGLVRDTGDDDTPVSQFTTNLVTFNISEVPMDSDVVLI